MMRKYILTIIAAASLCACRSLLPERVDIVSLGIVPESITVPASAGEDGVRVIADRAYELYFEVLPTTNRDKRNYTVKVSYTDGWGKKLKTR